MTDILDVKMEMCRALRADGEILRGLNLLKKSKKQVEQCILPRRYDRETLDENTVNIGVFEVAGGTVRANSSALIHNVEVDILVPEQHSTAADAAKERVKYLFDGAKIAGRRVRLIADPGAIVAATGYYRVAVRFCFSTYIKNF